MAFMVVPLTALEACRGRKHTQAVLALARRRVNVLRALIRDKRAYQAAPPRDAPKEEAA